MDLKFSGKIWQWRGPSPYYFVTVPEQPGRELRAMVSTLSYGWGGIRVKARIGDTEWETSLIAKEEGYVVPLRDQVRRAERVDDGDTITISLSTVKPAVDRTRQPAQRTDRPKRSTSKLSGPARRQPIAEEQLTIVPANEVSWADLRAVFDTGDPSRCWCQRHRMRPKESWASLGPEALADRFREQTSCGNRESATTSGLVAYLGAEPIGWCSVAPRPEYLRMLRNNRVPWDGRTEDKTDGSVWAVTCFVTRSGFRRRGVARALARTAVDFARQRGAGALEGYPDLVEPGNHVGTRAMFADAGLVEVSRPTNRRAVMRIDF